MLLKRFMDGRVKVKMKFNRKHHKKKNEAFVAHFRLLGLRRGECRTNVIRSAAQSMSIALSYSGDAGDLGEHSADDIRRARIALAAYRLLDPRERTDVYERVQLCYPIDREDMESPTASNSKLMDQMAKVPVKSKRTTKSIVRLMGQPVIDEAIEGDFLPDDSESEAARETLPSWWACRACWLPSGWLGRSPSRCGGRSRWRYRSHPAT
jgi:hypothetical protein